MMRGTLTALGLAGTLGAALAAGPLGDQELVAEIAGNTLTGYNGSLFFSEFHAPDGRIFGYNGGVAADGACWRVRASAICYYYPEEARGGRGGAAEFCWRFERAGAAGYRITLAGRGVGGIARLEAGNPRAHSDHGKSWTCDALISQAPVAPRADAS